MCALSSKNRNTDARRKYHDVEARLATEGVIRPELLPPSNTDIESESAPPDMRKTALAIESIRDRVSRQSSLLFSIDGTYTSRIA